MMLSDCCLILFSFILPLFIGWFLLAILDNKNQMHFFNLEKVFISYGLGIGVITLIMFYFSLVRIHFSFLSVSLVAFLLVLLPRFFFKAQSCQNLTFRPKQGAKEWKIYEIVLLLLIITAVVLLFFRTLIMESDKWDSWAVWGFKAKIYFVERIIPFQKFTQFKTVWGNWDYPHHVPLIETWTFLCLGQFNEQLVRVIFPVFHMGLVVCLYAYFRRHFIRAVSLCGAFFLVTLPILSHVTIGTYTEPILLFYYILSFRFLLEWKDLKENKYLLLSAIFSGLAAWTKNEGIAYALFNLIIIIVMTKDKSFLQRLKFALFFIGIVGAVIGPWLYVKSDLGLENILINSHRLSISYLVNSSAGFNRVIAYWISNCVAWDFLNLFRIMFVAYLILNWKHVWKSSQLYVMLTIFFHILLAMSFFFLDPREQFLREVFNRLLIAPSILIIMLVFYSGDFGRDFGAVDS